MMSQKLCDPISIRTVYHGITSSHWLEVLFAIGPTLWPTEVKRNISTVNRVKQNCTMAGGSVWRFGFSSFRSRRNLRYSGFQAEESIKPRCIYLFCTAE